MIQFNEHYEQSFEEITWPLRDTLFRSALRLAGNEQDAEDLIQETYLRAYRFFHRFEKGTNSRAWMSTIMSNIFRNIYRKKKSRPDVVAFSSLGEGFVPGNGTEDTMGDRNPDDPEWYMEQLDDRTKKALEALPENFRVVLLLNVLAGLSYREVAKMIDIPIGTVMSRLHRARKLMRDTLGKKDPQETPLLTVA